MLLLRAKGRETLGKLDRDWFTEHVKQVDLNNSADPELNHIQKELFTSQLLKVRGQVRVSHAECLRKLQVEIIKEEEAELQRQLHEIDLEAKEELITTTDKILTNLKVYLDSKIDLQPPSKKWQKVTQSCANRVKLSGGLYAAHKRSKAIEEIDEALESLIKEAEVSGEATLNSEMKRVEEGWRPGGSYFENLYLQIRKSNEAEDSILDKYFKDQLSLSRGVAKSELHSKLLQRMRLSMRSIEMQIQAADDFSQACLQSAEKVYETSLKMSDSNEEDSKLLLDLFTQSKLLFKRYHSAKRELRDLLKVNLDMALNAARALVRLISI